MINLVYYKPYTVINGKSNLKSLVELLESRGMDPKLAYDVPETGLLFFMHTEIVAAGFVRMIEGNRAMLDSYITNPVISPKIRNFALDKITTELVEWCKARELKQVLAFSTDEHVVQRSINHGFAPIEHKMTLLNLPSSWKEEPSINIELAIEQSQISNE